MSDNPYIQYANAQLRHKKQKSQGFHSDAKHAEREMIRISNLHKIKTGKHINDHAEKLVAHHEKAKEIKRQYVQHSTDLIHAKKSGDKKRMERAAKGKAQAEKDHLAHTGEPAEEKSVEYKRPIREGKQMKTFKELYEACCSACEKRDEMEESDSGLAAKADKSGVSIGTLRKVYKRGVAAWNSGHRPGTTPQQWGMARVNSYITKGKGTYHGADKDLREEELDEVAKDKESGLPKKYVSGLSPSTAKARAAHWEKMDKLSDKDPAAYEPAPGDATAKTKESKHTIKAREMFGDPKKNEIDEACWTGYKRVGMKKKGDKMVPNCVPEEVELGEMSKLSDTLAKIKHDFSTPPANHKDAEPSKPTPATKPKTGGGMPYYPDAAPGKRDLGDSVEYNGKKIEETQKGKNVVPPPASTIATTGGIQEEENENKPLGKVMRAGDGKKKFKVFVKNAKGNTVKVGFGDPNMEIKRDDPERRKNFRARHNCDTATDRTTPRYWSCRQWRSSAKVEA